MSPRGVPIDAAAGRPFAKIGAKAVRRAGLRNRPLPHLSVGLLLLTLELGFDAIGVSLSYFTDTKRRVASLEAA